MGIYGYFIVCFIVVLWLYHWQAQKWLDADEGQHHLASLLIAAAQGLDGVTRQDVARQLALVSKKGGGRRARLSHAVLLVRSKSDPALYAQVLALSREL